MEVGRPAIQSELPSWQMNGGAGWDFGETNKSSQQSCPHNLQNSLIWKSLSWSLKVHVMNFTRRGAESCDVTIVEAKKQPGLEDSNDWLYFPPKGLTTDIVIGVSERLCEMAQICKKLHHCKFKVFLLVVILL